MLKFSREAVFFVVVLTFLKQFLSLTGKNRFQENTVWPEQCGVLLQVVSFCRNTQLDLWSCDTLLIYLYG